MNLYENCIITKLIYDSDGNVVAVKLNESQLLGHRSFLQLSQYPDQYQRVKVKVKGTDDYLYEAQNSTDLAINQFYVSYPNGLVYFNSENVGVAFDIEYYGKGVELISTNRMFHKYDVDGEPVHEILDTLIDTRLERMDDIIKTGEEAVDNINATNELIVASEEKRVQTFNEMTAYVEEEIVSKDSEFQTQIANQQETFELMIDEQEGRFNNQMEAQQAEFDRQMDGAIFGHFNDKIEKAMDEFARLDSDFNEHDFNSYPLFYKSLYGQQNTVMQYFAKLSDNTWLFSQVGCDDAPPTGESFTISRLDNNGELLDYMRVFHGGHGIFQAVETEAGVELYFTADSTKNEALIKTTYQAGTILDLSTEVGYEVIPSHSDEKQLISIDAKNNLLMLTSRNSSGQNYKADIYQLDEYLASADIEPSKTLNNVLIKGNTLQGIAISGNTAFYYYGTIGNKCLLRVIDTETDNYVDYTYNKLGYTHDKDRNSVVEAECCFVDDDGNVYLGVSTGTGGTIRANHVYVFTSPKQSTQFISETLEASTTYKYMEGDGHAMWHEPKPSRLADITRPGWYYFTATEFNFEDVPSEYKGVSGFWLNVYPRAKDGTVYQELIRNTTGANQWRIGRQISKDKVASVWKPLNLEHKTLWSGDTRTETTLTLKDRLDNYDYLIIRLWHEGGSFTTETLRVPIITQNKKMFFHAINIGDAPNTLTFHVFELEVAVSDDMMTLTQSRKSRVSIANGGVHTREEDAKIGIHEIQGVRGYIAL